MDEVAREVNDLAATVCDIERLLLRVTSEIASNNTQQQRYHPDASRGS
jgi:hypothetical protein